MSEHGKSREIFPVGLLVQGRACTVIGGGKVALRKAKRLLDAGAAVTVVCREARRELEALAEAGKLTLILRDFETGDLANSFLVFAATHREKINKQILGLCREQGIYACSVDRTWPGGDFVTSATARKDGVTVSVSTGGGSCRQSKLVKDNLSRHLDMIAGADLMVLGTSHNYLSIGEREPFHLTGTKLQRVADMVMQVWGVHEFAILNTCNRIELIAVASQADAVAWVLKRMFRFDELDENGFYLKRGEHAFSHLSIMTAGLLSQTPGENHIVAQVKEAVALAVEQGWAGGMLQEWMAASLHISKHIRTETAPLLRHQEIEDLSMQYLDDSLPELKACRVLVIGAGVIGTGLVERLRKVGKTPITWCYRHKRPEVDPAWIGAVTLCRLNALRDELAKADVVVCATSSEGHVLHMAHAPFFNQESRTTVVDLAMPRNVSPDLDGVAGSIKVVDLDDLKHWFRRERADMGKISRISGEVVDEHRDMYEKLVNSFKSWH